MTPAMRQKCQRLFRLKMPAIFEGVGISFRIMCKDPYFCSLCNSKNALFVNLILPNEDEHKRRLRERCEDRGDEFRIINDKFKHIKAIGDAFKKQTEILSRKYKNVININCSGSKDTTVRLIIEAISRL
jgi:2-phosphoglycerate kinase